MNKAELVSKIADQAGLTKKDAEAALNAFMSTVEASLCKEEKVQLVGFGTFDIRHRKARKGRNPRDPKKMLNIPASKAPVFKAGKALKESVNSKKKKK